MGDAMSGSAVMCPSMAILSNWSERDWGEADGLQVETREDLDCIVVRTYNSVYELIVQCGSKGEVLVRGGRFFPAFTKVQLAGSSLGGSFLKRLGIYVGLRMRELFGTRPDHRDVPRDVDFGESARSPKPTADLVARYRDAVRLPASLLARSATRTWRTGSSVVSVTRDSRPI